MLNTLLADRGNLEGLPDVIEAKILEIEEVSQTQESRKRHKITSHLPLTAELSFCELELKTGQLISAETYRDFQGEIRQREQRRRQLARQEQLANKKKERHDLNDFNRYQRFLQSYGDSFPAMSMVDESRILSEPQGEAFPAVSSNSTATTTTTTESKANTSPTKGNYARIVRGGDSASGQPEKPIFSDLDFAATLTSSSAAVSKKGKGKPDPAYVADFPSLSQPKPAPSTPSVWGASAAAAAAAAAASSSKASTLPVASLSTPSSSSSSPSSWAKQLNPKATTFVSQVPPTMAALTKPAVPSPSPSSALESEDGEDQPVVSGGSGGGGKKGKKKTMLMSTTSQRRY